MKLGVLFSGGKDSCAAAYIAQTHGHEVVLLSMQSKNLDSYMFHTPNKSMVEVQAEAMGLPILCQETPGEKEKELEDLQKLIKEAVETHEITGVVTGAIGSVYQATRVQKICAELGLHCFNPLWQRDEMEHMRWLGAHGFEFSICAVAAYPMGKEWLGRAIDEAAMKDLAKLQEEDKISPAGEGGEFETFVFHGPGWKKSIEVLDANISYDNYAGRWEITAHEFGPAIETKIEREDFDSSKQNNVLIVSTCSEELYEYEFVKPIQRNVNGEVVHYANITPEHIEQASRIIICGTGLQDDVFLEQIDKFSWIKECEKPILGICAGFQIIAKLFGAEIQDQKEIGMQILQAELPLGTVEEAYFVHHNGITCPEGFSCKEKDQKIFYIQKDNLQGILFHPEVRNTKLLN